MFRRRLLAGSIRTAGLSSILATIGANQRLERRGDSHSYPTSRATFEGQQVSMFSGASGPAFWFAVLEVIWVNILLSGDNAVVIALACRGLPPRERMWGMVIGAGFASLLLILFTALVSVLMTLPYLRLASARGADLDCGEAACAATTRRGRHA